MQDRKSANPKKSSCNARPDHTFGSVASKTIRAGRRSMSAVPPKADVVLSFGAAVAIGWAQMALRQVQRHDTLSPRDSMGTP
jgi:hypothetical protein